MNLHDFQKIVSCSEDVLQRLSHFETILNEWNKVHNLVQAQSLKEFWDRHVLDSLELFSYVQEEDSLTDLGSGAGFPGIILAIATGKPVRLVESNAKKSAFLRHILWTLSLSTSSVSDERIVALTNLSGTVVCRALTPLSDLITLLNKNVSRETLRVLALKGPGAEEEIEAAHKKHGVEFHLHSGVYRAQNRVVEFRI